MNLRKELKKLYLPKFKIVRKKRIISPKHFDPAYAEYFDPPTEEREVDSYEFYVSDILVKSSSAVDTAKNFFKLKLMEFKDDLLTLSYKERLKLLSDCSRFKSNLENEYFKDKMGINVRTVNSVFQYSEYSSEDLSIRFLQDTLSSYFLNFATFCEELIKKLTENDEERTNLKPMTDSNSHLDVSKPSKRNIKKNVWNGYSKNRSHLLNEIKDNLVPEYFSYNDASAFCDLLNSNDSEKTIKWLAHANKLQLILEGITSNPNFNRAHAKQRWVYFKGQIQYKVGGEWRDIGKNFRTGKVNGRNIPEEYNLDPNPKDLDVDPHFKLYKFGIELGTKA